MYFNSPYNPTILNTLFILSLLEIFRNFVNKQIISNKRRQQEMLRQKRMVHNRKSDNKILNFYSNENLQKITPEDYNHEVSNLSQPQAQKIRNRTSLIQMSMNPNLDQKKIEDACISESKTRLRSETKHNPTNKDRSEDISTTRIVNFNRNEDIKIPVSQISRAKSFLQAKNRPQSSYSQRNRKIMDYSSFCQSQFVLQVEKKDQVANFQGPERMSSSRALMTFSKISRNHSRQRFKLKKGRHIVEGPIFLDTKGIILQQKYRKQNSSIDRIFQKSISFTKTKEKKQQKNEKKSRYNIEQDFEIGGWEYF